MNDRSGETPQADGLVREKSFPAVVPALFSRRPATGGTAARKKPGSRPMAKRDATLVRDSLFIIRRGGRYHVVSEDYGYKTESYYTILTHELEGKKVLPSSHAVLDAFVVPVCLERARLAGIPVCDWGVSQAYVPLPAVLYALNYFATTSEYVVVEDNDQAKDAIKHITNKGKYPFCYQKLPDGAVITGCTAIFGRTCETGNAFAGYAKKIYRLFGIPLVRMVFVKTGDETALSSLSRVRYNQLTGPEQALLSECCGKKEFP
jgi:hypothetical protein